MPEHIFAAFFIGFNEVMGGLWTIEEEGGKRRAKLLALGSREYYQKDADLVEAAQKSLESAFKTLGEEKRKIEGIIFSLPVSWAKGALEESKASLLRQICQKLESTPLGFVTQEKVVSASLAKSEGAFFNFILVGVGEEVIEVALLWQGKMEGVYQVERSDNLVSDLEEGLFSFERKEPFPPRIFLWGFGDQETMRQRLLSYPWVKPEGSLFLHLPKVELLPSSFLLETLIEETVSNLLEKGGLAHLDVGQKEEEALPEEALPGFVKDQDVAQLEDFSLKEEQEEVVFQKRKIDFSSQKQEVLSFFTKIGGFLPRLKRGLKHFSWRYLLPLLFLMVLGLLWWFWPQAVVTLRVSPQFLEENFAVKVIAGATVNIEEGVIPGEEAVITVEGEKSAATSGEKKVGEKATGEVTIYNRTEVEETLEEGTKLIASGDLEFETEEEVKVASASAGPDYTLLPGKKTVKVKAADIGPEYNLAKETEFKVNDFSTKDFIAKNENDFSGGSSREVKVVGEEDLTSLKESLKEELLKEGREKLAKASGEGKKLINESIEEKIIAEDYDHQVDDEAEEVSLNLKLELKGLVFKEEDLNKLIEERLKPKITTGFILGKEREVDFSYQESDGEGQALEVKVRASLYPKIDEEEVKKKLKGKRPGAAIDYLGLLPSVEDCEIEVSPKMPDFLLTLPHREERIKIEVKTNQ